VGSSRFSLGMMGRFDQNEEHEPVSCGNEKSGKKGGLPAVVGP